MTSKDELRLQVGHKLHDYGVRGQDNDYLTDYILNLLEGEKQKAWISLHQGATCCKDKHQTFYGAVVTSPQWELWQEKQSKNPTRDMAEREAYKKGYADKGIEELMKHENDKGNQI